MPWVPVPGQEWNHDGRYSGGGHSESRVPVLGIGMPVGGYYLSAVYSHIHQRMKWDADSGGASGGVSTGNSGRRDSNGTAALALMQAAEDGAARKMWSTAATVLLRQAMDEGWGHYSTPEVDTAAELWRLNWVDVELRQIAAWV